MHAKLEFLQFHTGKELESLCEKRRRKFETLFRNFKQR